MRAVALTSEGGLEVVDRPEPKPGPGEVVVAVERCGICGSDLHLKASGMLPAGAVLGHEFAGTIAARGEDAPARLAEGLRVAVLPAGRCGRCDMCRAGRDNLCLAQPLTAIGLGVNDGANAEYVKVPAASCHLLPPHVAAEPGALVEPYAVALHAVRTSRLPGAVEAGTGPSVGIVGAGTIGLMCLAAARRAGATRLAVAEPDEVRRAVAESMGAAVVPDASRLGHALDGPLDVVFEAAGAPLTPAMAVQAARPGGQVVLLGVPGTGQQIAMPGLVWLIKEVDVVTSMAYTSEEFATAVGHVASGAVDAVVAESDVRPLEDGPRSFDELGRPGGPVKVLLAPRP